MQLDRNENGPRAYLQAGSYFGELAALLGGPRRESFMALTHCFLYSLKHDALEEILHRHPQVRTICILPRLLTVLSPRSVDCPCSRPHLRC